MREMLLFSEDQPLPDLVIRQSVYRKLNLRGPVDSLVYEAALGGKKPAWLTTGDPEDPFYCIWLDLAEDPSEMGLLFARWSMDKGWLRVGAS